MTGTPDDRLDSWKEIAGYLKRDVTTVQRWEKREGMPVHRHVHDKLGSVYAFRAELDAWTRNRRMDERTSMPAAPVVPRRPRRPIVALLVGASAVAVIVALLIGRMPRRDNSGGDALEGARFSELTAFGGTERAAAISRDGRFVTFCRIATGASMSGSPRQEPDSSTT